MDSNATAAASPGSRPGAYVSQGRSRYVLAVLFVVGIFNMADRQILAILLEPIRAEFGASDTAMGLLTGFTFALFYALASVPLARLADTWSRRNLMAVALGLWSMLTALSGFVTSFVQLAVARFGVGIGEAAAYPASISMISDIFPRERRTGALAVFAVSTQVGIVTSLVVGGWLAEAVGWRSTLVIMGLPGIGLAIVLRLTVSEPARGATEPSAVDAGVYDFRATLAHLWSLRSFRWLALGAGLSVFTGVSLMTWSPAFLMRVHGMGMAEAGALLGAFAGIGGASGILVGGFAT